MYLKLVSIVRIFLAFDYLANGINWWFKIIDPYPSLSSIVDKPPQPGSMVAALIGTGFMFHLVKALEIAGGLAFISNRFVPLMLVVSYSVTVNVFLTDVFLASHLRAFIMGNGAMLMHTFLLLAYSKYFQAMLTFNAAPDNHFQTPQPNSGHAWSLASWQGSIIAIRLMLVMGIASAAVGAVMVTWLSVMIVQHFIR